MRKIHRYASFRRKAEGSDCRLSCSHYFATFNHLCGFTSRSWRFGQIFLAMLLLSRANMDFEHAVLLESASLGRREQETTLRDEFDEMNREFWSLLSLSTEWEQSVTIEHSKLRVEHLRIWWRSAMSMEYNYGVNWEGNMLPEATPSKGKHKESTQAPCFGNTPSRLALCHSCTMWDSCPVEERISLASKNMWNAQSETFSRYDKRNYRSFHHRNGQDWRMKESRSRPIGTRDDNESRHVAENAFCLVSSCWGIRQVTEESGDRFSLIRRNRDCLPKSATRKTHPSRLYVLRC